MHPELADALSRLEAALGQLENAVGRHFDVDARQSDLQTELGIMQDDRARLAAELDTTAARLARVENAAEHVGYRVELAIGSIQAVLGGPDGPARADAGRG